MANLRKDYDMEVHVMFLELRKIKQDLKSLGYGAIGNNL